MRVGVIGPALTAVGGVSTYCNLLRTRGLGAEASYFDFWPDAHVQDSRASIRSLWHYATLPRRLRTFQRDHDLVHLMVTSSPRGLLRDAYLIEALTFRRLSPVVAHFHGGTFHDELRDSPLARSALRKILSRVDLGIVLSALTVDVFREIAPAAAEKVHALANPVGDNYFAIRRARPQGSRMRVLCTGEIGPRKNQLALLDQVEQLAREGCPIELRLVGPVDAAVQDAFKHRLASATATSFAGTLRGAELWSEYAQADLFCLFSNADGLPIAILEAMAAGLPVVATDVGDIASIVDSRVGGLIAPGSTQELAILLRDLAEDGVRRTALGDQARERAGGYSLDAHVSSLTKLYISARTGTWQDLP